MIYFQYIFCKQNTRTHNLILNCLSTIKESVKCEMVIPIFFNNNEF